MEGAEIFFQFCQIHRQDIDPKIVYAIIDDICPGLINSPKIEKKKYGKIIIQFDCQKWINLQTLVNLWMNNFLNVKGIFFNHLIELLISKIQYLHKNGLPHGFLLPSYIWIELDKPLNNLQRDTKIQNIYFLNHQIFFKDILQKEISFCEKQDINFIQLILTQILKYTSSQNQVFEIQSLDSLREIALNINFSSQKILQNQATLYDGQLVSKFLHKNSYQDCSMVHYLIITKFYLNIKQYIEGNPQDLIIFQEQNANALTNLNPATSQISLNWSQRLKFINQESFINFPKCFSEFIFCASNLDEYIELQNCFQQLLAKIEQKVQELIQQIEKKIDKFFKLSLLDCIKKQFYFAAFDKYFYLILLEKNKQNHENLISEIYKCQDTFLEKFENLKLYQLTKEECLQALKRNIEKVSNSLVFKQTA